MSSKTFSRGACGLILLSATALFLMSCPTPTTGGGDPGSFVLSAKTKILGADSLALLGAPMDGSGNLLFTGHTAALDGLAFGDFVVSGRSANAPAGVIRKVTSVSPNGGGLRVATTAATLEDAVQSGTIAMSTVLASGTLEKSARPGVAIVPRTRSIASRGLNISLTDVDVGSGMTVSGEIAFDISLNFSIDIDWFTLKNFTFTTTTSFNSNLQFHTTSAAAINALVEVGRITFAPIDIQIASFPLVFIPVLSLNVGVDGTVSANIVTGVSQTASLTTGVEYDGSWHPVKNFTSNFSFDAPQVGATCSLKGFLGPQMSLLLYGIAGPAANLYGYVELEASGSGASTAWSLYAGMELGVSIKIEVCSRTVADWELANIIDYRKLLAQGLGGQSSNWTIEKIASAGSIANEYRSESIALDAGGNPHVAFGVVRNTGGRYVTSVCYARRVGGVWDIEEVARDDAEGVPYYASEVSIALDPSGVPHLIVARNDSQLMYYTRSAGGWTSELAAQSLGSDDMVINYTLKIDGTGVPHVAFHDAADLSSYAVRYAVKRNGSWSSATIESADLYGTNCTLAVDAQNVPHVLYTRNSNDNGGESSIRYAKLSGSTWQKSDLELNNWSNLGYGAIALVTDSSSRPHALYYSQYCTYQYRNGSVWSGPDDYDTATIFCDFQAIQLTAAGYPCIAYDGDRDVGGGSYAKILRYGVKNEVGWIFETVDNTAGAGSNISAAIDGNDKLHIVYLDSGTGAIRYAKRN